MIHSSPGQSQGCLLFHNEHTTPRENKLEHNNDDVIEC